MRKTKHVWADALAATVALGLFLVLSLQTARAGGTVQTAYDDLASTSVYPYGYHYACWYEPYGHRYCGLWYSDRPACPWGFYYTCRYQPGGYGSCGCY